MCTCLIHQQRYPQTGHCVYCGPAYNSAPARPLPLLPPDWSTKPLWEDGAGWVNPETTTITSSSGTNITFFPTSKPEGA